MVVGLDIFTEHFKDHTDHYILIGGSACERHFDQQGILFRATKDLDIILVVEALSDDFVYHFWQFIRDGEYLLTQQGDNKRFYRFVDPQTKGYPYMIELFSRNPGIIKETGSIHLTDIPTSEEVSSLSAILLDNDYYDFTITNSTVYKELRHANDIALIVLKAKAYLNNRQRANDGQKVQEEDIIKHRRDVIRLAAILNPEAIVEIPDVIKKDMQDFVQILKEDNPDIEPVLKNQGIFGVTLDQIIELIEQKFNLN